MNRPQYLIGRRMERPRPSQALYDANLARLQSGSTTLKSNFVPEMQEQSHSHALEPVNLTARLPPDEFEKALSIDDARAYAISCNVPNYVGMRFIMQYVHDNQPHLFARSVDDPSLLLPLADDAPLVPRGFPRTGGLGRSDGRPPTLGACSRKITVGISPVLDAFTTALAKNKVNIFECAAQTTIVLEDDKEYAFRDLFDPEAYPFSKIGTCCVAHFRSVALKQQEARSHITHYLAVGTSVTVKPRLSTKATEKSAGRTRPKKRAALTTTSLKVIYPWESGLEVVSSSSYGMGSLSSGGTGASSSGGMGSLSSGGLGASSSGGVGASPSGTGTEDDPICLSSGSESDSDSDYDGSGGMTVDEDTEDGSDCSTSSDMSMSPLRSPFHYQY